MQTQFQKESFSCSYLNYKYTEDGELKVVRLPMVNVILTSNVVSIKTPGLVDSGATSTFLPLELADTLGLQEKRKSKAIGAGGHFVTKICEIDEIAVSRGNNSFLRFYHRIIDVPERNDMIPYLVLGRDTIFKENNITFFEKRKKITFVKSR
jgi:hypothetical protein